MASSGGKLPHLLYPAVIPLRWRTIFKYQYGFSPSTAGLAYLGLGIGMLCGLFLFTIMTMSDKLLGQKGGNIWTSSRSFIRAPFGAFLTFIALPLYAKLGLGWGNGVLGFICLAFTPVPWLFYRYGEYLRTRLAVKL